MKLAFAHEESAEQCKKYHNDHEAETFVCRPAVAVAHNLSDIWIQLLNILEIFSHAINNLVNVLTILQIGSEPFPQELLDNARGQRQSNHRAQGTEEIRACRHHSLIFRRRIRDCK